MIEIFDKSSILGAQRLSVLSNNLIAYCIRKDSSFEFLFQNKFLKYEFEKIDEDDLQFLNEMVAGSVSVQLEQYMDEEDVASINEVLALLVLNKGAAKYLNEIGISVDEFTNELSESVEPKLSSFLKIIKVFGLTVQNNC